MVAPRWNTGKNRGTDYSRKPEWPAGGRNGRGILPLFGLLLVLTAAAIWLLAGCVAQVWTPPGQDGEEEWTACKAEPDAECLFNGLIVIAKREQDEFEQHEALTMIVLQGAGEGEFVKTLALAASFEVDDLRSRAFEIIAVEQATAGYTDEAIELARSINDSFDRDSAYYYIVKNLAERALFEDALQLVQEIDNPKYRELATGEIAVGLSAAGQSDRAETLAAKLVDKEARARTLAALAVHYKKSGHPDLASKMLAGANDALEFLKGSYSADLAKSDIVRMFSEAGIFFPDALVIAYNIEDDHRHAFAALDIARGMVAAGMMKEGLAYAENMAAGERDYVIIAAVNELAEAGRYDEAFDLSRRLGNKERLAQARADIAMAQWKAGIHDESLRVVRGIETGSYRARSLTEIAAKLTEAGRGEKAALLLKEAVEVARGIEDGPDRMYALADAAGALDEMGKKKEALGLAIKAMQILETIDKKHRHIGALTELAVDLLH